jgi:thioesterase domain-containing protein
MGAFFSGGDEINMANIMEGKKYYFFIVVSWKNNQFEYVARASLNEPFQIDAEAELLVMEDENCIEELDKEIEEKVKRASSTVQYRRYPVTSVSYEHKATDHQRVTDARDFTGVNSTRVSVFYDGSGYWKDGIYYIGYPPKNLEVISINDDVAKEVAQKQDNLRNDVATIDTTEKKTSEIDEDGNIPELVNMDDEEFARALDMGDLDKQEKESISQRLWDLTLRGIHQQEYEIVQDILDKPEFKDLVVTTEEYTGDNETPLIDLIVQCERKKKKKALLREIRTFTGWMITED